MAPSPLFVTTFGGGGRDVLALHGVSAHGLRFVRLAALLPGLRVVAPDLRGHGRSPKSGPFTVAQHVRDLLPLLESAQRPVTVLGHSFGGLLAWQLARAAPDVVDAVVLVDPAIAVSPAVADEGRQEALSERRWSTAHAAFEALLEGRSVHAGWAVALDVAVALEPDEDGRLRVLTSREAVMTAWEEMRAPLSESDYRGRVLLIEAAPERGRYVSAALVRHLRSQLGDRLEHVKVDAPHTIPADRPEALAELVRRFAI